MQAGACEFREASPGQKDDICIHGTEQRVRPRKKLTFRIPTMSDSKALQRQVVNLAKEKDLVGLIRFLEAAVPRVIAPDFCVQSAKMAINISGTLLTQQDLLSRDLQAYHDAVCSIVEHAPSLAGLENVQHSLIKTKLSLSQVESAIRIATECKDPRLRLFSTIIEHCAHHGDHSTAVAMLSEAYGRELIPTEQDYINVFKSMSLLDDAEYKSTLHILLRRMSQDKDLLDSGAVADYLLPVLAARSISCSSDVCIETDRGSESWGICPVTHKQLQCIDLTDEELDGMIDLTRSLSLEASKLRNGPDATDEFTPIIDSLLSAGPLPSVILDAANIAHINQNFEGGYFRFDQIESVLNHFKKDNNRCLVVIHSKWLNEKRDLALFTTADSPDGVAKRNPKKKRKALPQIGEHTVDGKPVEMDLEEPCPSTIVSTGEPRPIKHAVPTELVARWREAGEILEVPHGQNDDWFWLHVCLLSMRHQRIEGTARKEILLISNDQMRDHLWRMKNPKFFDKFKARHVAQYSIRFGEDGVNKYEYFLPTPFSVTMQVTEDNVWHVPYHTGVEGSSIRWLVVSL